MNQTACSGTRSFQQLSKHAEVSYTPARAEGGGGIYFHMGRESRRIWLFSCKAFQLILSCKSKTTSLPHSERAEKINGPEMRKKKKKKKEQEQALARKASLCFGPLLESRSNADKPSADTFLVIRRRDGPDFAAENFLGGQRESESEFISADDLSKKKKKKRKKKGGGKKMIKCRHLTLCSE